MHVEKITDEMFLVEGKNEGRFPFSHSVLIKDDRNAIIDTGCGIETLQELRGNEKIDLVINSHSHADHSAGNWVFEGVPIWVPEEEFSFNGNMMALSLRYADKDLQEEWRSLLKNNMGFKDTRPTDSYSNGFLFNLGKTKLEAIYTPGHSVGHHCFLEREKGILLSCDIDMTEFGPWYGHEESSIEEFRQSIMRIRSLSLKIMVSSHKGIIEDDIPCRLDRYFSKFCERAERILSMLDDEKTIDGLADMSPIYGQDAFRGIPLRYWEKNMIEKHLKLLLEEGRVERRDESYRRIR